MPGVIWSEDDDSTWTYDVREFTAVAWSSNQKLHSIYKPKLKIPFLNIESSDGNWCDKS